RSSETASEPMARTAAAVRLGCLSKAIRPEATIGTAGMSQRFCAMKDGVVNGVNVIVSCIRRSPFHPVHLVEFGGAGVAIDRNHQAQSHRGFGRGDRDRE